MKKIKLLVVTLILSISFVFTAIAGEWANALGPRQYKKDNGDLAVTEWIAEKDGWYYFGDDSNMKTGWFQDTNEKWYFFRYDGVMQTGLIKVSNEVFYLNDDGSLFEGEKEVYGNIYKFTITGVEGRSPGVINSRTFGINGIQSSGGGNSSSSSNTANGNNNNGNQKPDTGLEDGETSGPGK